MSKASKTSARAPDQQKLDAFLQRMLGELGPLYMLPLVRIGDKLGLYKAMKDAGPQTSAELAKRSGTAERYLREWLAAHAAAGYFDYDPTSGRFEMNPEQGVVFADDDHPYCLQGAFQNSAALFMDHPKILEAFKTGAGVGWHEHNACYFSSVNRFFRPLYRSSIVESWLPALDGVVEKLENRVRVADVGCGFGASTIVMAKAFPKAEFVGFDFHEDSIAAAREAAAAEGLGQNISFEVGSAKDFPARDYDLVCFFDCLHDLGDPAGAAAHVLKTLAPDGTWLIVEPFAHDKLEDNLNLVGRIYYAASTMACTPCSLSQEVGLALGAQAGEARLREVVEAGGFTRFRRAAETPFNLILEARP